MIQLVRNCESNVELVVTQPQVNYCTNGRKSTLLSPAKKHKLKARPIRVRFAESVCVNGSPLFPVICYELESHRFLNESCLLSAFSILTE